MGLDGQSPSIRTGDGEREMKFRIFISSVQGLREMGRLRGRSELVGGWWLKIHLVEKRWMFLN